MSFHFTRCLNFIRFEYVSTRWYSVVAQSVGCSRLRRFVERSRKDSNGLYSHYRSLSFSSLRNHHFAFWPFLSTRRPTSKVKFSTTGARPLVPTFCVDSLVSTKRWFGRVRLSSPSATKISRRMEALRPQPICLVRRPCSRFQRSVYFKVLHNFYTTSCVVIIKFELICSSLRRKLLALKSLIFLVSETLYGILWNYSDTTYLMYCLCITDLLHYLISIVMLFYIDIRYLTDADDKEMASQLKLQVHIARVKLLKVLILS